MVSKVSHTIISQVKGTLREELDAREAGESGFAQPTLILNKMNLLLSRGEAAMRDSVLGRELVTGRNDVNDSVQFIFEGDEVNISNELDTNKICQGTFTYQICFFSE